jgi:Methylamine utilisation protein MauE
LPAEALMDPALTWTVTLALSTLFGASAAMKFAGLERFAAALDNYRILPLAFVAPAAWSIPAWEALAAIGLLFAATRTGAAILTAALLAVFSVAIAVNLARGRREIDCGCFGRALRQPLSGSLLIRNAALFALAAAVMVPAQIRPLHAIDFVTIVFGSATLIVLYASMNYLLANAPWVRELERLHA